MASIQRHGKRPARPLREAPDHIRLRRQDGPRATDTRSAATGPPRDLSPAPRRASPDSTRRRRSPAARVPGRSIRRPRRATTPRPMTKAPWAAPWRSLSRRRRGTAARTTGPMLPSRRRRAQRRRSTPRAGFAASRSPQNVASASQAVFKRDGRGSGSFAASEASTTRATYLMSPRATPPGACCRFRFFVSCWALRACRRPSASSWSAAQAELSAFSQRFISFYGRGGGVIVRAVLARRAARARCPRACVAAGGAAAGFGGSTACTLARARSNDVFDRAMLVTIYIDAPMRSTGPARSAAAPRLVLLVSYRTLASAASQIAIYARPGPICDDEALLCIQNTALKLVCVKPALTDSARAHADALKEAHARMPARQALSRPCC